MSNKLLNMHSRRFFRNLLISEVNYFRRCSSNESHNTARLFFSENVQDLLKKLTRVDIDKVYSPKREGGRLEPPKYKFMTTKEYENVKREAESRVKDKLQMPPVVDVRKEIEKVLIKDENLVGYSSNKFVFTDITFGVDDRKRSIVVRDEDGTLREARWNERSRMNQTYFPKPGRKILPSKKFQPHNLERLLTQGEYLFVLDAACCELEPDDPLYVSVCEETYKAVDSECAYNKLRSTRHYGPLVFYLAKSKKIDNLLLENMATDRLEDAVWLISLYHLLNPDAKSAGKPVEEGKELSFIENYIKNDSDMRDKLELTLQTYREYFESKPKSVDQIV